MNAAVLTAGAHATVATLARRWIQVGDDVTGTLIDFPNQLLRTWRLRVRQRRGNAKSRAERHERDELMKH